MSKKKKFRFKAHQKAQLLQQLQQAGSATTSTVTIHQSQVRPTPSHVVTQKRVEYEPITPIDAVRQDIKKIGLIVGVLAVILVGLYLVDRRSNINLRIGQRLTSALGI